MAVHNLPVRPPKRSKTDEVLRDALPAPEEAYDFKINSVCSQYVIVLIIGLCKSILINPNHFFYSHQKADLCAFTATVSMISFISDMPRLWSKPRRLLQMSICSSVVSALVRVKSPSRV